MDYGLASNLSCCLYLGLRLALFYLQLCSLDLVGSVAFLARYSGLWTILMLFSGVWNFSSSIALWRSLLVLFLNHASCIWSFLLLAFCMVWNMHFFFRVRFTMDY